MMSNLKRNKMKTNKFFALGLCALALSFSSCEDYLDINESPNQAPDAPVGNVLTAAMTSVMINHSGEDARLAAIWSQQFSGVELQYQSFDLYNITSGDFDWGKHYYGVIEQCNVVIEKASITSNNFHLGVAKTLKAHAFGTMASLYGDIPFTEANQFPAIENPKFDNQTDVYTSVQILLDEAINNLQNSTGNPVAADLFYDGDASQWIKLANSLKARYFLHNKNYSDALTFAANGILSPLDNFETFHGPARFQDQNIYYQFGQNDRPGSMTAEGAYLPTILNPSSMASRDNAKTSESDRFHTIFDSTGTDLNYERMWAIDAPFALFTALETNLILAESNARNGSDQAALDNLNDARAILSATYTGNYDDYLLVDFDPTVGINDKGQGSASANLLYEIIEEKYISLVGQIEVFNDVRRSNNILGLTPKGTATKLPQRYIYPQDELNTNTNAPGSVSIFIETAVNN